MYGTIARLTFKPGMHERFVQLGREIEAQGIPGWVAEYIYQADTNPDEYFMAVVFESKEAYRKNAESPEQDAIYRRLRELLAADPEWHDGEIIFAKPQGGA
jgi:heme-degrading monooxygenase HmoA